MKSRYLITGGAGFIGSALANELIAAGNEDVTCLDDLSTGSWDRLDPRVSRLEADLTTLSTQKFKDLFAGVEVIFHLAAVKLHNNNNSFESILKTNVDVSHRIFEAAGDAGVRTIVFSSSLYSYGLPNIETINENTPTLPTTIYGASKLFGESMLSIASQKFGFAYSIARLFFIYGESQYSEGGYKSIIVKNFERFRSGKSAIINGDGKQILDYLYVGDCVDALILLSKNPSNQIFNISSGIPLSIEQLTSQMAKISGVTDVDYASPDWTHNTRRVGSNHKILKEIGWVPKVNLEEGLRRTWSSLN
jgi:UDP-glucose 4-epimerase